MKLHRGLNWFLSVKVIRASFALLVTAIMISSGATNCQAESPSLPQAGGQVQISLTEYSDLTEQLRQFHEREAHAPVGYALGSAKVDVSVTENEGAATAEVQTELSIQIIDDNWQLVRILPSGVSVESAIVSGNSVNLIATAQGLSWGNKGAGSYQMSLRYKVDARRSSAGFSLPLPLPVAAATSLTLTVPGSGTEVSVIPSTGSKIENSDTSTSLSATIPSSSGVQISWRSGPKTGVSISRAQYSGTLSGESVRWTAEFQAENFGDESVDLTLLPKTVTLSDLRIDGKPAPILVSKTHFFTQVKGRGIHKVAVDFQVAISRPDGRPQVEIPMSEVPVSRIDFTLPGRKEVTVTPASNVTHKTNESETTATAYVPMTPGATLHWTEAIPEEKKQELRASANLYHAVHAEEGVLSVHAMISYEITRGATNVLELEIPKGVDINRISSAQGGIADWRLTKAEAQQADTISIFLDRELKDNILLDVFYDRSLAGKVALDSIQVPLIRAKNVHRQRGMLALLASKELTLKPTDEKELARVGENQLPPFVRQDIKMTIAHTFKYAETEPTLMVQATTPEKKQGRFDALVSTLVSLTDVTLKGSAGIELNVKSGVIADLQLELPLKVNVLSLTAPSLRTYKVTSNEKSQLIDVQFTQEMEGQFRLEVNYEFIMEDNKAEVKVPTLNVKNAEVEQGRIAVEALSVVEVQPALVSSLSTLDPGELPQQLVLKTTNPILLAYKYVRVDPPYDLSLKITRHKEIEVQTAAIDRANYKTLFTKDGISVTAAQFFVRNTGKQFLRVQLPEGSKVWSASVNGNPEKPALAEHTSNSQAKANPAGPEVLIKIVNSAAGFPVQLIYQTPVSKIGNLGTVRANLPRPDMVVTSTTWDIYLPDGVSYGRPDTNMELRGDAREVTPQVIRDELKQVHAEVSGQAGQPLQLMVPSSGISYSFEKVYANESEDDAYFSVMYGSGIGRGISYVVTGIATAMLWISIIPLVIPTIAINRNLTYAMLAIGISILVVGVGYFGTSAMPVFIVSLLALLLGIAKKYQSQNTGPKPIEPTSL